MVKNKKYIFFFVLIIALLLLAFVDLALSWSEVYTYEKLVYNFFLNLPGWLFMGIVDLLTIKTLYKKFRWKKDIVRILLDLIISNIFIIAFSIFVNYCLLEPTEIYNYIAKFMIPILIWNSILVLLIEVFFYIQKQNETAKQLAIFEKEKLQYQYDALKVQINPHFLFNSLNVLSSLTYQDADKANLFAKKMSGVYRYLLLTNTRPTVTLKEELAFLESYIFLEKIRFEEALHIEINNKVSLHREVIPVSLQLLVENALKHNITTTDQPLTIFINITDKEIVVSNNIQLRSSVDKGGIGLANLQKQYALHDKEINIRQTETEFIVKLPFIE